MVKIFLTIIKNKKIMLISFLMILILYHFILIIYPNYLNFMIYHLNSIQNKDKVLFILLSMSIPITSYTKDILLNYIDNILAIDLTSTTLVNVLKKNKLEVDRLGVHYINQSINNFSGLVCNFFLHHIVSNIFSVLSMIIMILLLSKQSLWLTLFVLSINLIKLLLVTYSSKKISKVTKDRVIAENTVNSCFNTYIQKLKLIKTRNKETQAKGVLHHLLTTYKQKVFYTSGPIALTSTINNSGFWVIQFLILIFCMFFSKTLGITFYMMQLAIFYSQQIGTCFQNLASISSSYATVKSFYEVTKEILDIKETKSEGRVDSFKQLSLKDISFSYQEDSPIIQHFSNDFIQGNIYILKGSNGRGKSTLFKLISGIYPYNEGEILLDSISLDEYNMEYYQSQLIVSLCQDHLLFEGSIEDNLLCNDIDKIKEICHDLNIQDLNKKILPGGTNLSIGQRRKLLLARTFLRIDTTHPSLVLLDEPLYALETHIIPTVEQMIYTLSLSRIVMIISHDDQQESLLYKKGKIIQL